MRTLDLLPAESQKGIDSYIFNIELLQPDDSQQTIITQCLCKQMTFSQEHLDVFIQYI